MTESGWTVSEEGIAALNNMAAQLEELSKTIHDETSTLMQVFEENQAGLGAHAESIRSLIEDLQDTEEDATIPVKKLVLKLQRAALIRARSLNDDPYSLGTGRSR